MPCDVSEYRAARQRYWTSTGTGQCLRADETCLPEIPGAENGSESTKIDSRQLEIRVPATIRVAGAGVSTRPVKPITEPQTNSPSLFYDEASAKSLNCVAVEDTRRLTTSCGADTDVEVPSLWRYRGETNDIANRWSEVPARPFGCDNNDQSAQQIEDAKQSYRDRSCQIM